MVVLWGLDLREITWSKFGNANMWNTNYHLRRTKFIVYQLAMILCVISESLGTAALSDYVDQQTYVQTKSGNIAKVHNDDYIGAASYNIWCGIFVAFIFGAAFFFDLIWPERHEDRGIKNAWRACSIMAVIFEASDAITLTVITFQSGRGVKVTGVDSNTANQLISSFPKASETIPKYSNNPRAIAAVAFVWPGLLAVIASTIVMWMSLGHNDREGPKSTHYRNEEKNFGNDVSQADAVSEPETSHAAFNGATTNGATTNGATTNGATTNGNEHAYEGV
ncbi:hypothetical protein K490DRAFT_52727 [Saccharata proteae CBS 121410]|uniref:Uncharacterized protein n=1 Tax=Saccharata proteae CBS 121410 TaxID=1314787 RepID=A0A9P4LZW0_9PEZI|nr:hypothetical protein K490DRAFT_52727 [Saccharata proteae CBS 121410]